MTPNIKASVAMAALMLSTAQVNADVRYDFTALSSIPFEGYSYTGAFSVVVPTFISNYTNIPVSALLNCSALTTTGPVDCLDPSFEFPQVGYDVIGFGAHAIVPLGESPNLLIYYYFSAGAFNSPGTYFSQIYGAEQAGTLVVSVVPTVPEPTSGALLIVGGIACLGFIRKQHIRTWRLTNAA